MNTNKSVVELIQKAANVVGSEAQLARVLGMPHPDISQWKSGKKGCTAADRARLAGIAREDAVQELVRATLEKYDGTLRGEQLRQLLGKWSHQTGAASVFGLLSLASGTYLMAHILQNGLDLKTVLYSTMYKLRLSLMRKQSRNIVSNEPTIFVLLTKTHRCSGFFA